MDLPEFLSPPPEKEAIALALDALVFGPLQTDEAARKQAGDDDTPPLRAFVLLDGSVSSDIQICAEAFDETARCLFDGAAFEELAEVGPWLIELRRHGDAFDWFLADGWGNNWGIVIHTRMTLPKLKTHLKKFIKVEDEDGQTYFFKFYRPEHLNNFLPAFEPPQHQRFMRGIDAMMAEAHRDNGTLLHYTMDETKGLVVGSHDLIETGMPLRIQVPDESDVEKLIAALEETA